MNRITVSPVVIGVVAASAATAVVVGLDLDSPIRQAVAMWFLFFTPGMAFVPLLALDEPMFEWTLFVAVSLMFDGMIGVVTLYAGLWSPNIVLVVLIALSLIGASLQGAIGHRPTSSVAQQ